MKTRQTTWTGNDLGRTLLILDEGSQRLCVPAYSVTREEARVLRDALGEAEELLQRAAGNAPGKEGQPCPS